MKYFIALIVFLFSNFLFAQEVIETEKDPNEFYNEVEAMFDGFDFGQVNTGILLDLGEKMARLDEMDGSDSPNASSSMDWHLANVSLYTSQVIEGVIENPEDRLLGKYEENPEEGIVELGLLNFSVNEFKENALTNGDITYINGVVGNVQGRNPFKETTVFSVGSLHKRVKGSTNVQFRLEEENVLSNVPGFSASITKVEVDYGVGGYKTMLKSGGDTFYQLTESEKANFNIIGDREVLIRVSANNETFYSKTSINIDQTDFEKSAGEPEPAFSINANHLHSGGQVYVEYACPSEGVVRKPFIVVEGFDVGNFFLDAEFNLGKVKNQLSVIHNGQSISDMITAQGFDLVFLDFNDGTDNIYRNAALLKELIEILSEQKGSVNSLDLNTVYGMSMGGLVSRIALSQMESEGIDHQTKQFISLDTPHQGANVPMGMQGLMRAIFPLKVKAYLSGIHVFSKEIDLTKYFSAFGNGLKVINSMAARQMLIHRVSGGDIEPSLFQQFYNNLPDLPKNCENFALSNGSLDGNPTGVVSPSGYYLNLDLNRTSVINQTMVDLDFSFYGLLKCFAFMLLNGELKVVAKPTKKSGNSERVSYFKLQANFDFLGLQKIKSEYELRLKNYEEIDNAPGGQFPFLNVQSSGSGGLVLFEAESFTFVPTVSALNHSHNFYTDLTNYVSPVFEEVSGPPYPIEPSVKNEPHIFINKGGNEFFAKTVLNSKNEIGSVTGDLYPYLSYNFGENEFYNSTGVLTSDLVVKSGAHLHVNGPSNCGFNFDSWGLPTEGNQIVNVFPGCNKSSINIVVENGGELVIGRNNGTGTLNFTNGSKLILKNGSKLKIDEGSIVNFLEGSELVIENGAEIIIENNGECNIQEKLVANNITISGGGVMAYYGSQTFTFSGNNGFRLNNNAKFILGSNAVWNHDENNDVFLNGGESFLELRGKVFLKDNQTFSFQSSISNDHGFLVLNRSESDPIFVNGIRNSMIFPNTSKTKKVLTLKSSESFHINENDNKQFDHFILNGGTVNLENNAKLFIANPVFEMVNCVVNNGRLSIYRNSSTTADLQNSHRIISTDFNGVGINDAPGYLGNTEPLFFSSCSFFGNSDVYIYTRGIKAQNCNFLEGSHVTIKGGSTNEIKNSSFQGVDHADVGILLLSNYNPLILEGVTIKGYRQGLSSHTHSEVTMTCSEISDNLTGFYHGINCVALFKGVNKGQNKIINNHKENIYYFFGDEILLSGGNHNFMNENGGGFIFSGYLPGGTCTPQSNSQKTYMALGNQWDIDPNFGSNMVRPKFNLESVNMGNCEICPLVVLDVLPEEYTKCGISLPDLGPVLGSLNQSQSHSNQQIVNPKAMLINQSVLTAIQNSSFGGGFNDIEAFKLLVNTILNNCEDHTKELYVALKEAYFYAKLVGGFLQNQGENDLVVEGLTSIYEKFDPINFSPEFGAHAYRMSLNQAELLRSNNQRNFALDIVEGVLQEVQAETHTLFEEKRREIEAEIAYLNGLIGRGSLINAILDSEEGGIIYDPSDPAYCWNQVPNYAFTEDGVGNNPGMEQEVNSLNHQLNGMELNAIQVYPIPAKSKLNINCVGHKMQSIIVKNSIGAVVFQMNDVSITSNDVISLDLSSFSPGAYILEIGTLEGGMIGKKFMKK